MNDRRKNLEWFKLANYEDVKSYSAEDWENAIHYRRWYRDLLTRDESEFPFSPEVFQRKVDEATEYWLSVMGISPDIAAMTLAELWGIYCLLKRLTGGYLVQGIEGVTCVRPHHPYTAGRLASMQLVRAWMADRASRYARRDL